MLTLKLTIVCGYDFSVTGSCWQQAHTMAMLASGTPKVYYTLAKCYFFVLLLTVILLAITIAMPFFVYVTLGVKITVMNTAVSILSTRIFFTSTRPQ